MCFRLFEISLRAGARVHRTSVTILKVQLSPDGTSALVMGLYPDDPAGVS